MNIDIKPVQSGVHGAGPVEWYGKTALDATRGNWARAPIGSRYIYKVTDNQQEWYTKTKNDKVSGDWQLERGWISQKLAYTDFTDGGGATGTKVLNGTIPLGALATHSTITNVTGFTGNVSATVTIGDGTDTDRYNTGTPSVFTTIAALSVGIPSGTAYHAAAIATVTVTVAASADYTAVAAGLMTVTVYYR